ncbi:hypothetical protein HDU97_004644 [Phlyctochytrium planicorne]|nr:hypothetical protein HDU97_004644 [Phlyctochytrium planicorne]
MSASLAELFVQRRFAKAEEVCHRILSEIPSSLPEEHIQLVLLFRLRNAAELGREEEIWEFILERFGSIEALPDVFVNARLTASISQKKWSYAKDLLETWLSAQWDAYYERIETGQEPFLANYERLVELYVLHILPKCGEIQEGIEFLNYNYLLRAETKQV